MVLMMGFQHTRFNMEKDLEITKTQIYSADKSEDIRDSASIDNFAHTTSNSKGSVPNRLNSMMESMRSLFTPSTAVVKRRSSSMLSSTTRKVSSETSSGYQSLDASWELDESYIKVAKFTDTEEDSERGHYGTYKEYKEMAMQQSLASQIKDLVETNAVIGNIKISDYLTLRTAGDVMNLSKSEPYGLKGCKLILLIEDNGVASHLGDVFPEKGIVCTFEITLVLHVKKNVCRKLPFFNCKQILLNVLDQYELRKEKMYKRRSSPVQQRQLTF